MLLRCVYVSFRIYMSSSIYSIVAGLMISLERNENECVDEEKSERKLGDD